MIATSIAVVGILVVARVSALSVNVNTENIIGTTLYRGVGFTLDEVWFKEHENNFDMADLRSRALVRSLGPTLLRSGGTEADWIVYNVSGNAELDSFDPTTAYLQKYEMQTFCEFFNYAGWSVFFGLNARQGFNSSKEHTWNSTNAESLIRYAMEINCPIIGWELGNELNLGKGKGQPGKGDFTPAIEGEHFTNLGRLLVKLYGSVGQGTTKSPYIVGPDSTQSALEASDPYFLDSLLEMSEQSSQAGVPQANVLTWHQYMHPGQDLWYYLDPSNLEELAELSTAAFDAAQKYRKNQTRNANAILMIGECGIELNSDSEPSGPAGNHVHGLDDGFGGVLVWSDRVGTALSHGHSSIIRQQIPNIAYQNRSTGELYGFAPSLAASVLYRNLFGSSIYATSLPTNGSRTRIYAASSAVPDFDVTVVAINLANSSVSIDFTSNDKPFTSRQDYVMTAYPDASNIYLPNVAINDKVVALEQDGSFPNISGKPDTSSNPSHVTLPPVSVSFFTFKI